MLNDKKVNKKDLRIGLEVIYFPERGKGNSKKEPGKVTTWNDTFVFVDYDGTGHGKATKIEDLIKM